MQEPVVQVTARAIKIVVVLDSAATVAALRPLQAVNAQRVLVEITVEGRKLTGNFSGKSVRKAIDTVKEHGATPRYSAI
jgi:hypothetical protein